MPENDQLEKLRKLLRLHTNWLTLRVLGKDSISSEELNELKAYGKLPLEGEIGLVEKSFILGRVRSLVKKSEYKNIKYKELERLVDTTELSEVEKLAVQEAKLHAATYVKKVTDDLAAGAFNSFGERFSEEYIRGIIKERTAEAIEDRLSSTELAEKLVSDLKAGWKKDWKVVAATELHRAKVRGTVMAIATQTGIYSNSDGIDSYVSVVPNPDTCDDCAYHYLDSSGNPKIMKLKTLLEKGSNGDSNVDHKRGKGGLHTGWKTTLSPLHPQCRCQVVYVPPGMSWEKGKLKVVDQEKYEKGLSKAADRSSLSATVKPPGPKSTQGASSPAATAANPPSLSGAPAPSNTAGPGRPKEGPEDPSKQDNVPCPFGGGDECEKHGGNGAKTHNPDGEIMKEHQKALSRGAKPEDPEAAQQVKQSMVQDAIQWGKTQKDDQTVRSHLKEGNIADVADIGPESEGAKGINDSWLVTIDGNGRACMKPPQDLSPLIEKHGEGAITAGIGTVPHGSQPRRERAASNLFKAFGLDYCPPTEVREHGGQKYSMQQWQENHSPVVKQLADNMTEEHERLPEAAAMMELSGDKGKTKEALSDLVTMDIVMNSNDRHMGNVMTNDDFTEVKAIDHGVSFGSGMMGYTNAVHKGLHTQGYKVSMSDTMQERLKNTSYGDLKRSLGDDLEGWEIGQTFLRTQYALHLQETDGHLDYKKLQPYLFTADEDTAVPDPNYSTGSTDEAIQRIMTRTRSHELFEEFSLNFLEEASNDSSHPHHEAAKELKELGVFMGPGFASDPNTYRREGKHKEYEEKVKKEVEEAATKRKVSEEGGFSGILSGSSKKGKTEDVQSFAEARTLVAESAKKEGKTSAANIEDKKQGIFGKLFGKKDKKEPVEEGTAQGKVKKQEEGTAQGKVKKQNLESTAQGKVKKSLYLSNPDMDFRLDK